VSKVNISEKFERVSEHWRPKIVASLNGQDVKVVKVKGEFPWHSHEKEDELFMVWRGRIRIEFRDHVIDLGPGELTVVPHGVEHRPVAEEEAEILLFEPAATVNTGDVVDEMYTAPLDARI
jgi:mannose-6-phosphate isomerase-like protein (cupin superfamily)